jgi:hypothetical protein
MNVDTRTSIHDIRDSCRNPFAIELASLQNFARNQEKSFAWASRLRCLSASPSPRPCLVPAQSSEVHDVTDKRILEWTSVATSFQEPRYIAVSYVWEPAPWEDPRTGAFWIRSTDGDGIRPAKVRNCVLERIMKFAKSHGVSAFWIDR